MQTVLYIDEKLQNLTVITAFCFNHLNINNITTAMFFYFYCKKAILCYPFPSAVRNWRALLKSMILV